MAVFRLQIAALSLMAAAAVATARTQTSKREFLRSFGSDYGYDGRIDKLWKQEVAPRLSPDEHYLDYTGSSLYWNSQVQAAFKELEGGVFGNPHSDNPSSLRTEALVEALRTRLLAFLGADPEQYDVVWTRSGTGGLRELGETFPWSRHSRFAYLVSNHNSVLGIREYARAGGASFGAVSEEDVEAWVAGSPAGTASGAAAAPSLPPILRPDGSSGGASEEGDLAAAVTVEGVGARRTMQAGRRSQGGALHAAVDEHAVHAGDDGTAEEAGRETAYSLFAFPAYDNFAGVMYPLSWVRAVQAQSTQGHRWKVLVDAAAFLPTHPLNLTETPADYVCISFYKLFGYPTGVGAWVARKDDISAARKVYWGGGSVFLATSQLDWKHFRPSGGQRFEDGTLPFLSIMALHQGLDVFDRLGGVAAIERHTSSLRAWTYTQLSSLRHSNGAPLLRIFGRHHWPNARQVQGSTFNFQILKPNGTVFSYRKAATVLAEAGFSMRCGCTCNPGACYGFLGLRDEEVKAAAELAHDNFSDWEWVWVNRSSHVEAGATSAANTAFGGAPVPGAASQEAQLARHGAEQAPHHLVKLPLGSLRASLGYMARHEDVQALVDFLQAHYTDRTSEDFSLADLDASMAAAGLGGGASWSDVDSSGSSGSGGGSGGSEEASRRQQRRQQRLARVAPEVSGPGWC